MRRCTTIAPAGSWPAEREVASVTLDFDRRHRRRFRLSDDAGEDFLLDLAKTARLGEGDGLMLEDGGIVRVRAAEEAVLEISCGSAAEAARIAWHIGNRHTPVQVLADGTLRIRDDHVLGGMIEGLGATVKRHTAPFDPESGAYAGSDHGHSHDH
jgi:urease accessory protein